MKHLWKIRAEDFQGEVFQVTTASKDIVVAAKIAQTVVARACKERGWKFPTHRVNSIEYTGTLDN